MGVAGTLEYLSDMLSSVKKPKKKKQIQTVALKVRMDCEGCERKVKNVLSGVKGTVKFQLLSSHHACSFSILMVNHEYLHSLCFRS